MVLYGVLRQADRLGSSPMLKAGMWNAGQHNIHQRIQHHQKVKDENNALKQQLACSREESGKMSVRSVPCQCLQ